MAQRSAGMRPFRDSPIDPFIRLDRGDGQVAGGQRLGHRHQIGFQVEGLGAPHIAGPAEAADHLVDHEQHVVAPEDALDLLEVGRGRDDHAARTHHRLGEEGGDGLRPLGEDQALQRVGAARGEFLFGFPVAPFTPVVRAVGVEETGERQIEPRVVRRHAGHTRRRCGDAVIAALPPDDLLLRRAADGVVVEPDQLDRGVDRLGARVGEEGARHRHRRQRLQAFGELHLGFVAPAVEPVIEGQRAHLAVRRLGEALVPEAERDAPEPGHPLDIFLAGLVPDIDPVAARHDQRAFVLVLYRVGIGVEQRLRVAEPV